MRFEPILGVIAPVPCISFNAPSLSPRTYYKVQVIVLQYNIKPDTPLSISLLMIWYCSLSMPSSFISVLNVEISPPNTSGWSNVGSMLGQSRRRWTNSKPTNCARCNKWFQCILFEYDSRDYRDDSVGQPSNPDTISCTVLKYGDKYQITKVFFFSFHSYSLKKRHKCLQGY